MSDVDASDVADAILSHPSPVVTAGDLADQLGCSSRHVLTLLRGLEAVGIVESRDTGARAVAWWHTERVLPPPGERSPADHGEREPDPAPGHVDGGDPGGGGGGGRVEQDQDSTADDEGGTGAGTEAEHDGDRERGADHGDEGDVHPDVREAVDRAAEWWDDDERHDDRRGAARTVLEAVRESDHGLTRTEIVERYAEEYAVPGQSEDTWWRRNIAEGAEDEAAPAPLRLVADYSRGTHKWTWRGLDHGAGEGGDGPA